jgi:hypothetical protein
MDTNACSMNTTFAAYNQIHRNMRLVYLQQVSLAILQARIDVPNKARCRKPMPMLGLKFRPKPDPSKEKPAGLASSPFHIFVRPRLGPA